MAKLEAGATIVCRRMHQALRAELTERDDGYGFDQAVETMPVAPRPLEDGVPSAGWRYPDGARW